ncbi:MAG: isochorismate synthase [Flavobacteriales bacterium]|nr:isochorismate synthase [Flavobacteriales bacterium]
MSDNIEFLACRLPASINAFGTTEILASPLGRYRPVIVAWDHEMSSGTQPDSKPEDHAASVQKILNAIQNGEVEKVVLSRVKTHRWPALDPVLAYTQLKSAYGEAFVFLIRHPNFGMWLGATPELLLFRKGKMCRTMALAGTRSAGATGPWSNKLIDEQLVVTRFIEDTLAEAGATNIRLGPRYDWPAGKIVHLRTDITFEWNAGSDVLLKILHPTPAVCGYPRHEAAAMIRRVEQHKRKLYAGYSGVIDTEGDEELYFVNLRCMQLRGNEAELFAGGGINSGSDPNSEWNETEQKLETLINVIR